MSRKLIICLAFVLLVVQAQAYEGIATYGGRIYTDASSSNTVFTTTASSTWSTTTGGAQANLWWERTGFGYNENATLGGAGASLFEALTDETHWRSTGDVNGLKTTVTGLVDSQAYDVYVVFGSKSLGENWNVTADFSQITTNASTGAVTSGYTYGADANAAAPIVPILKAQLVLGDMGGNIYAFAGLIGTVTGDSSGTLDVYIDDLWNTSNNNDRTWYDGVYLVPEPMTIALLGLGGLLLRRRKR